MDMLADKNTQGETRIYKKLLEERFRLTKVVTRQSQRCMVIIL